MVESITDRLYFLSFSQPKTTSFWLKTNPRFVWLGGWRSRRIENTERIEKWEDRKDFSFFHLCLVREVEKWRD